MTVTRRPAITTEMLASRKAFDDRIYFVGPFASRVSFSSQQRRAISLICDIHEDFKKSGYSAGLDGLNVCVIGAGLAGLTSAVVAASLSANVYILENRHPDPAANERDQDIGNALSTFRKASHRDGHPTLNFWPQEDVEPFTRLPLLNWHEGACPDVAEQILDQYWDFIRSDAIGTKIKGIQHGRKVTSLAPVGREPAPVKWQVKTDPPASPSHREVTYDCVIFATGFGEEHLNRGLASQGYWEAADDVVETLASAPPPGISNYVVSGTGDGGLIDLLRLLFPRKRAGNIEEDLMGLLSDRGIRDEVSSLENRVQKKLIDFILHDNNRTKLPKLKNELSEILFAGYEDLVQTKVPDARLRGIGKARSIIPSVTLLGEWRKPMELGASPIHRFMLAIAMKKGWVDYLQVGKVTDVAKRSTLDLGAGKTADIVDLTIHNVDGSTTPKAAAFYLQRHGYDSPLTKIWEDKKTIARIRRQQSLFADQDQLRPEHVDLLEPIFRQGNPNLPEDFYSTNRNRIQAYFERRYGLGIELLGDGDRKRFRITKRGVPHVDAPAVPLTLFGFSIENRQNPDEPESVGRGFDQ